MLASAKRNLSVAALNALVDHGLKLSYASTTEEERTHSTMNHAPLRLSILFEADGVPCVAACRPAGYGEEKVAAVYDCADVDRAVHLCQVGTAIHNTPEGTTAVFFYVERERGPYIMSTEDGTASFRYTLPTARRLSRLDVAPQGFAAEGRFIL